MVGLAKFLPRKIFLFVAFAAFNDDQSSMCSKAQLHHDNSMKKSVSTIFVIHGLRFGYFPRHGRSWLIFKPNLKKSAREIFAGANVCITTDGH